MNINKIKIILSLLILALILQGCQFKNTKKPHKIRLEKITSSKQINDFFKEIWQKNRKHGKQSFKNINPSYDCLNISNNKGDELCPIIVTGSRITSSDSITNNQVAGVDEGDIIKQFNNMLIILRKGTLYSIDISDQNSSSFIKLDEVKAFSPYWQHDAFFDEILINNGIILVLGFNYDLDVSEIIRFELTDDGKFTFKDNYLINSEDYYDPENYASRLFNHQFTSYIPIELYLNEPFEDQLPQITKVPNDFSGDEKELIWNTLFDISDIYFPIQNLSEPTLHSFIVCPLNQDDLICNGVGVISSNTSLYYNNGEHIYMWVSAWKQEALDIDSINTYDTIYDIDRGSLTNGKNKVTNIEELYNPLIYRISLNDFDVDAVQVQGMPVSQFSFHHQNEALYMYGLIDKNHAKLMEMPDSIFDKAASKYPIIITENYEENSINSTQRFIGNYFLIGNSYDRYLDDFSIKPVNIINIKNGKSDEITLTHYADRIEAIDEKALVVGTTQDNNLGLSLLSLKDIKIDKQTILLDRLEGESRSHAFNFKYIEDFLLTGITTQFKNKAELDEGYYWWDDNIPSDITFIGGLDNFDYIGGLVSDSPPTQGCTVSCDDWYGNSRPFFIENRIFALTGDELIEASLIDGKIVELSRINITD